MKLFLLELIPQPVLKALAWTLLHSIWQAILFAILAGIMINLTSRTASKVRYNFLCVLLFGFIGVTLITFAIEYRNVVTESVSLNVIEAYPASVFTEPAEPGGFTIQLADFINRHAPILTFTWLLIFLFNSSKLVSGLFAVQQLRRSKSIPVNDYWKTRLEQLCDMNKVKRNVAILESALTKVPLTIGLFKPVIFFPLGLITHLPPQQIETIILHELAHIRRFDYFVNILQRFAESIFFFNPAFLWMSSIIRSEREACCDDQVLSGASNRRDYLEALVAFHDYSFKTPSYAMTLKNKNQFLLNRVRRILEKRNSKLNGPEILFLCFGFILLTAFATVPLKNIAKENAGEYLLKFFQPVRFYYENAVSKPAMDTIPAKNKISAAQKLKDDCPPDSLNAVKVKENNSYRLINETNRDFEKLKFENDLDFKMEVDVSHTMEMENKMHLKNNRLFEQKMELDEKKTIQNEHQMQLNKKKETINNHNQELIKKIEAQKEGEKERLFQIKMQGYDKNKGDIKAILHDPDGTKIIRVPPAKQASPVRQPPPVKEAPPVKQKMFY